MARLAHLVHHRGRLEGKRQALLQTTMRGWHRAATVEMNRISTVARTKLLIILRRIVKVMMRCDSRTLVLRVETLRLPLIITAKR